MARRPDILSDRDNWGEVLNDYLDVSLAEDGTIRPEAVPFASTGAPTEPERTLSVVGDLHIGFPAGGDAEQTAAAVARMDTLFADLATLDTLYARRVYVGDQVETPGTTGTTPSANDIDFLARANALDDDWLAVAGNHDINSARTASHWGTVYGLAQNYTVDLGFCRLIALASDGGLSPTSTLSPTTLQYLDDQLAASKRDAIILCHFPLYGTAGIAVEEDSSWSGYSTFATAETYLTSGAYAQPDADVRAILNRHAHARIWLCGHSHSPITAPDLFKQTWLGDRYIAVVNAGSPVYTNATAGALGTDDVRSLFVTMLTDRAEIRVRNHTDATWEPYQYEYAWPMPWGISTEAAPDRTNPAALLAPLDGDDTLITKTGTTALTITGPAVYEDQGGLTGLFCETGSTNRATNPIFYASNTSWSADNATLAEPTRETDWAYIGPASGKVEATGANASASVSHTIPTRSPFTTSFVVRNDAAGDRTFKITYDGNDISDPVVVGAGEIARIESESFTGAGTSTPTAIVMTDSEAGDVFRIGHLQIEEQARATEPIPQLDDEHNLLDGFSWSGTPFASFSLRDATRATVDPSGVLYPDQGALVVRARFTQAVEAASNYLVYASPGGDNRFYLRRGSNGTMDFVYGGTNYVSSLTTIDDTDIHTIGVGWRGSRTKLYLDGVLENDAITNALLEAWGTLSIGHTGGSVIYGALGADRELTPAEHAALHAAPANWSWEQLA